MIVEVVPFVDGLNQVRIKNHPLAAKVAKNVGFCGSAAGSGCTFIEQHMLQPGEQAEVVKQVKAWQQAQVKEEATPNAPQAE